MAYNLGDLVSTTQDELDDSSFDASRLKRYANRTQEEIFTMHDWTFAEASTTVNLIQGNLSFTVSGATKIESIKITTDDYEIDLTNNYLPYKVFNNQYPDPSALNQGSPWIWTYREDTVLLSQPVDQAYALDVEYQKEPTELDLDADVPEVPARHRELMELGMLMRAQRFNDDYDLALDTERRFNTKLLSTKVADGTKTVKKHIASVNGRRAA